MNLPPLLNPYLDLHRALSKLDRLLALELRKPLIWSYAWVIPGPIAVAEIGAGSGYWAWLCRQAGADVLAPRWPGFRGSLYSFIRKPRA